MTPPATANPAAAVEAAIRSPKRPGAPALIAFLTGGFPDLQQFARHVVTVSQVADVVEVGVPFRDPMADGVTIQRSSHTALDRGASLARILDVLREVRPQLEAPVLLMSYLNPLLVRGPERLCAEAAASGVHGFIVPDLPLEESELLGTPCSAHGLALVQLATPATPDSRLAALCARSSGFLYAVTVNGVTGGGQAKPTDPLEHLRRVRTASPVPVCAGFGIRNANDVARLHGIADGAIVGTALIEAIENGTDPADFVRSLHPSTTH